MKRIATLLSAFCFFLSVQAQPYEWPADTAVRAKLERWRDQKFGIIIHWGLYAVPGIIESWSICSEDWITRDSASNYEAYKQWYWGLKNAFHPTRFDPQSWARAAKDAGMRYLVFTTKHHDGFCMFDTHETDFKITNGPFGKNPRSNVTKEVFKAFRQEGMMVGAYFSKPDWHSEDYWWPLYATPDRNNNYDIRKFPWRWERFRNYTYNQVKELMTGYGPVDLLWLDGGWVRPRSTINEEVRSWGMRIPEWSQDIDLPRIAGMARAAQPGLLIVDRTVHGAYENYRTPEQRIPEAQLDYPWESCMTLADNWGYVPRDRFKPASTIIRNLVEVVSKGGNLLLGIGPDAAGQIPDSALQRMQQIGDWLRRNGEAIYNTRPVADYKEGNTWFTGSKEPHYTYALVAIDPLLPLPASVSWSSHLPAQRSSLICLQTGQSVKWKLVDGRVVVDLGVLKHARAAFQGVLAFRMVN